MFDLCMYGGSGGRGGGILCQMSEYIFSEWFSLSTAGSQYSLVGQVHLPTERSYRVSPAPLKTPPLATHRASSVGPRITL